MSVRLYGRVVGHGSHATVTEGFRRVLAARDQLAGVLALDVTRRPDEPDPPGAGAPVGLLTGALAATAALRRNVAHRHRCAMVAPNSNQVPPLLVKQLSADCTHLLAPSDWAASVLRAHVALPIATVPHGVSADFRPDPELRAAARATYDQGAYDVLHLSSSDRERKGTAELLLAWRLLEGRRELPPRARLILVLDYAAELRLRTWMADEGIELPSNVILRSRGEWSPAAMARIYSAVHVVCQPSRGEGFGCVPVEARASGVPVCFTAHVTGHTEHGEAVHEGRTLGDGSQNIEHGPDAPIDDQPGAWAPSVPPEAIAAALSLQYRRWPTDYERALERADAIRAAWAWERQLADWLRGMEEWNDGE